MNSIHVRTLGRYHLLEQIGKGGMAAVFKAYDPKNDRNIAIKVLSPAMAQHGQFSQRFRREAEVVMKLNHPNIVPVEDFGEENGYAYLVMPLLQVGSLTDRLQEGPISPREGSRLMEQVCNALQFAHDQGVIHRDVKPSNILMDAEGNALLSDFGLARIHDASVSLTGSALLGTPAYMSPEQARGDPVDARGDQYSLGVILYQLSTGTLPFDAETPMAVLMKHINEPLPLARARSPNVPEVVEHVILKATAKNPNDRFESVAEMNHAFQAAIAHVRDPRSYAAPKIDLPPPTMSMHPAHRLQAQERSTGRRIRRLAAAAGLLLLLLLACPATSPWASNLFAHLASPAEGSVLPLEEMNDPELTALAGTIEALSTELAASHEGTLSPEMIPTLVMETMVADYAGGDGTGTPVGTGTSDPLGGPFGGPGTGTAIATHTPGPSPTPSRTHTPGPSPTPSRTPTNTHTWTPGPSPTPSKTPTASRTPTSTYTWTPGPSPTASKTPTKTPTSTSPPPTPTGTTTASPVPSKTPTKTATPIPSKTPTIAPTTPPAVAPTDPPPTPTIDICSQISLGGFAFGGHEISVTVTNNSPDTVMIEGLHLDWPPPNERLKKIEFGGNTIWDHDDHDPPTDIPAEGGWKSGSGRRKLDAGEDKSLIFLFEKDAEPGGYWLILFFDNGCDISVGS